MATVARHGYGGASVARVIERAGVSRATFYEHFADRHECFLAAYRGLAAQLASELQKAGDAKDGVERVRTRVLARLLEAVDGDPAAARLLMIEALAAGPDLREEHERLLKAIERSIETWIEDTPREWPQLQIPARALLGGVEGVLAVRVFRGETGRLVDLFDDLLAWVGSYALPSGRALVARADWLALGKDLIETPEKPDREDGVERPPRSRGSVPPAERRERILAAVARLSVRPGYAEMTVADIVAEAGVNREAFYELFRSKEDAFLDTQTMALQESMSLAGAAFFAGESWPDQVWGGLETLLRYIASRPHLIHLDAIEAYAAGAAAIRRSFENRMAYTVFLEDGYRQRPQAKSLPRLCSEAIAAAIQELVRCQVAAGRTEQMLEILPEAVYVALAPFIGPEAALALIEEKTGKRIPRSAARRGEG